VTEPAAPLEVVLITGMSGSGKSVALHALEDAGFYCVDNLPPELLLPFVELERESDAQRVAIAVDVRSATSLPLVPVLLKELRSRNVQVRPLFLDATTDTLVRRFSETRRRHPLSGSLPSAEAGGPAHDGQHALVEAIELEREFDVRMLPNPHYEPALRDLTGRDEAVIAFLQQHADVEQMYGHIEQFLNRWLEPLARDHRSYVTVAIGCTGGQHRSVYLVERLAAEFGKRWIALKRHRELDAI
jgi:UPF0042 nucleotide-binding protein